MKSDTGCAPWAALLFASIWTVLLTAAAQFGFWLVDELINEIGAAPSVHSLQAVIQLFYALAILIPFMILNRSWRDGPRPVFRSWALAGGFALCLAPIRLVGLSQTQLANLFQIVLTLLFLAISLWLNRRAGRPVALLRPSGRATVLFLALAVAALSGLPWLAWGALGSPLDTFLNLAAALLLGAAAAWIFAMGLFDENLSAGQKPSFGRFLAQGWLASTMLAVLATAFGIRGHAWLLLFALPPLGWVIVALRQWQADSADAEGQRNHIPIAWLVGLAAAFPLLLIDPTELSLAVTGGAGELIQWATLAGEVTLAICLLAALALYFLKLPAGSIHPGPIRWALPLVAVLVAAGVYILFGRPGFYGEKLFVILKGQADVSSATTIQPIAQRRAFVYRTLVSEANRTQASLRSSLDQYHIHYTPYYLVNGLEVDGGPLVRAWLERRPEVDRVLDSPHLRPLATKPPVAKGDEPAPARAQWDLTSIGADRVWNELGVTGKGVVVGQSDSGVQGDHPDLAAAYRGAGGKDDYNWLDPWYGSPSPIDDGGHGTHTLGSILGKKTGVAPGATWIACINEARNQGNEAYYLDCMQFMLAPYPRHGNPFTDGDPSRAADVLNNSWGCPVTEGCDPNAMLPAVRALRDAGIFVVASAGNDGLSGCSTVRDPLAIYAEVYSVGAVSASGQLASFSSLGPVTVDGSQRVKPDITAPGEGVLSTFPGGTYATESGTSMAGPHVVGVVALMWSANPALVGNIDLTRDLLDRTARPYQGPLPACVHPGTIPSDAFGYGIVDAYAAVAAAIQQK